MVFDFTSHPPGGTVGPARYPVSNSGLPLSGNGRGGGSVGGCDEGAGWVLGTVGLGAGATDVDLSDRSAVSAGAVAQAARRRGAVAPATAVTSTRDAARTLRDSVCLTISVHISAVAERTERDDFATEGTLDILRPHFLRPFTKTGV